MKSFVAFDDFKLQQILSVSVWESGDVALSILCWGGAFPVALCFASGLKLVSKRACYQLSPD